jgi:hypothetical protein
VLTASIPAVRAALAKRLPPHVKRALLRARHRELPRHRTTAAGRARPYDARIEQAEALAAVRSALAAAHIEFVEAPRLSAFRPSLIVRRGAAARVLEALHRTLSEGDGWTVQAEDVHDASLSRNSVQRRPDRVARVVCHRTVTAPTGRTLTTGDHTIAVELWDELDDGTPDGDGAAYPPGTLRRRRIRRDALVEHLAPDTWHAAIADDSTLRLPADHLWSVTEPVDLVYTWVDGDDPAWRRSMLAARDGIAADEVAPSALAESRFTSRDELRYSLRSVEYYASWFRRIHLVTDGQVPAWLDTDHPRITVVDHRDIFTDPGALPVFNSHAIESQLHHIDGLSDRYVYLNDDVFFLRPTDPELFFEGNGIARFFPSIVPLDVRPAAAGDLPVMSAAKHGRDHLIARHGRTVTHRFQHTPHPQVRAVLEELEAEAPDLFARVSASRFRHPDDVSIASSLHHHEAYARGRAVPGTLSYQYIDLASPDRGVRLDRAARRTDLDVLCLNESTIDPADASLIADEVGRFLRDRFPVPSSFEKNASA